MPTPRSGNIYQNRQLRAMDAPEPRQAPQPPSEAPERPSMPRRNPRRAQMIRDAQHAAALARVSATARRRTYTMSRTGKPPTAGR